ncbi:MAG: hypothetical protein IT460_08005 [Planctomycetes bacterium]|nr:hypothetical protein [Planctomycetota bacterium]
MNWYRFFLAGMGLPFTAYVVLQALLPWRVRGRRRWIAFAPAPVMAGVLAHALDAESRGQNLWPIGLIFLSPAAIVAVCVLTGKGREAPPPEAP